MSQAVSSSSLEPVYLSTPNPSVQPPASPESSSSSASESPQPLTPDPEQDNDGDSAGPSPPHNTARPARLRKGTRLEDAYPSVFAQLGDKEPDPSSLLATLESPFQVQEYIAHLVRADPHAVSRIVRLPMRGSTALVQREVWIYEQLRRLAHDLGYPLVSALQTECSRPECPEMKAGEWLYLCAAHATANENECCAIDYVVHTLDGATALLNSARYFPSRLQIPASSIKHFTSIARRLYRILAHAWFHHRELFEQCETETSLYARFLALADEFGLIAEDLLVIPRGKEGEGEEEEEGNQEANETAGEVDQRMSVPLPDDEDDELEELE